MLWRVNFQEIYEMQLCQLCQTEPIVSQHVDVSRKLLVIKYSCKFDVKHKLNIFKHLHFRTFFLVGRYNANRLHFIYYIILEQFITVSPVHIEEFGTVSNLEIPNQERLLPIGSMPILVENLKVSLGLQAIEGKCKVTQFIRDANI